MFTEFMTQMIAWMTPINLVLFALLIATAIIVYKAQNSTAFDFGNMLRDEEGKESAVRLAAFGAFAVSTWVIMQLTITAAISEAYYALYLTTWSGSVLLSKFLEIWKGKG